MTNDALMRFSKKFNIPIDSPDIINKLIEEISKLKKETKEANRDESRDADPVSRQKN